jgi:hypothetical protein
MRVTVEFPGRNLAFSRSRKVVLFFLWVLVAAIVLVMRGARAEVTAPTASSG